MGNFPRNVLCQVATLQVPVARDRRSHVRARPWAATPRRAPSLALPGLAPSGPIRLHPAPAPHASPSVTHLTERSEPGLGHLLGQNPLKKVSMAFGL